MIFFWLLLLWSSGRNFFRILSQTDLEVQDNLSFIKWKLISLKLILVFLLFCSFLSMYLGFPGGSVVKNPPIMQYEIDSITDSMDINLSKLQEVVEEHAIVHEVTKRWSQLRDWTTAIYTSTYKHGITFLYEKTLYRNTNDL